MPLPNPPEPDIFERVGPELTPEEARSDVLLRDDIQFDAKSRRIARIQEDRAAYMLALGMSRKEIAKRLGHSMRWVYQLSQRKEVAEKVILHRRDLVEKAKGRLVQALVEGLEKVKEIKDQELPENTKQHRTFLANRRQQFEAACFLVNKGLEFVQGDHALQKLEEKFFGPKTPTGPLVQINQSMEQPSPGTLAVEHILRKLPEDKKREYVALMRAQREIEAPAEAVVVE